MNGSAARRRPCRSPAPQCLLRAPPLVATVLLVTLSLILGSGCSGEETKELTTAPTDGTDHLDDPTLPDAFVPENPPPNPAYSRPLQPFRNIPADEFSSNPAVIWLPSSGDKHQDGITPVDHPDWVLPGEVSPAYLAESDLVIGVENGSMARAYPRIIMLHHEVVRTCWGDPGPRGLPVTAMTYCPLTNTAINYVPPTGCGDPRNTGLGVSGFLVNNNLVLYDRSKDPTDLYGQMVLGGIENTFAEIQVTQMECTWAFWKKLYPHTRVVGEDTHMDPNPDYRALTHEYTEYWRAHWLWYGDYLDVLDDRLPTKRNVFGVFVGRAMKAYELQNRNIVLNDVIDGLPVAVWYFPPGDANVAFERELTLPGVPLEGGKRKILLTFALRGTKNGLPVYQDAETGTLWNIAGIAIEGELAGRRLSRLPSYRAFWFAWAAYFPSTELWTGG